MGGEVFGEAAAGGEDDGLRFFAQGRLDERSGFDADLDQIGEQSTNLLKGAVGVVVGELQDFFSAGADAFVTFFEFLEQRGTLGETAMTFANVCQILLARGELAAGGGEIFTGGGDGGRAFFEALE